MAGPPSTPAPTRGRRDRRGEQRRAELLEAAIHLIGAHGLDGVTHRAVAAEAGVSPASTSYYFRSKDELIDEALNALATREILEAWKEGTDDLAETAMASLGAKDVRTAGILLVCAIDGLRLRLMASGHEPLTPEQLRAVIRALLVGLLSA